MPATLYKFCIILAMNSSFCSKADRSKGGEGPEECWGRVRMYTESLKKLLESEGRWGGEVVLKEGGTISLPTPQGVLPRPR